ncbi:MAG: mannose-6-phosphate isomerase [Bacteroidetes bacterium]|jgi:mannose-6-phosphate isomerase|nr:mannose-6-phosphate isomerase [Bacteroidota bacterium]
MTLYPLKFTPIYKTRIWGGHRLEQFGKHSSTLPNIGESWELSGVPGDESEVSNGLLAGNTLPELIEVYMDELVGKKVFDAYGQTFPLLIKLIDANDDLSIQVHPDDVLAAERHNSFGKTEMWYALEGKKNANLISGFIPHVSKEMYLKHLEEGTLEQLMARFSVEKGDVFFIPAGRVHAIGRGCLVAEIQQTSDVTYRLFDFNRTDDQGNLRELHTELALDAINFAYVKDAKTHPEAQHNVPCELAKCNYFTTNLIRLTDKLERDYYHLDSFVIYMCIEGSVEIRYDGGNETMVKGETVLLPASLSNVTLIPQKSSEILEIYV